MGIVYDEDRVDHTGNLEAERQKKVEDGLPRLPLQQHRNRGKKDSE